MAWIKAEYAEEVAVVTTWIATLLPWSVAYTGEAFEGSRIFFFRLPAFGLQLRFPTVVKVNGQVVDTPIPERLAEQYGGFGLLGNVHLELPPLQLGGVEGTLGTAYLLWSIAMLVIFVTFGLSVAMYLREDAVRARLPLDYVTLTGIAFAVLTVLLGGAAAAFATSDAAYGTPLPIGVVFFAAFAVMLLRAERAPNRTDADARQHIE